MIAERPRGEGCHELATLNRRKPLRLQETEKDLEWLLTIQSTIEDMVNLSLVIRDSKLKDNLLAVNVINNDNTSRQSENAEQTLSGKAAMMTTAVNVPLRQITRYDLNIASGIIHSAKENEITSIITGLHHKANITDSFSVYLPDTLLKRLNCELIISKFLIPVHTLKRIVVAVPPKAEYESGFPRWMEHFCRIGGKHARLPGTFLCKWKDNRPPANIDKEKAKRRVTDFLSLEDWNDLLVLTGQVSYDHLLNHYQRYDRELSLTTVLLRNYRDSLANTSPT